MSAALAAPAQTPEALLRRCFQWARAHPFYRDFYQGVADASQAAPVDKRVLQQSLQHFSAVAQTSGVYLVRSGGSSQTPLIFPVDIQENLAQRQALAQCLTQAGIFGPRTVALNLFGYSSLYRTAAIMDDVLERCLATTLPMSAHAGDDEILAVAKRFHPSHVMGTPSRLAAFAGFLETAGLRLDIPQLLYAGELLHGSALAKMRAALGEPQLWSLYGGAETGIWAWSDASLRPGLFEIIPQVVVEILEPDAAGYGAIAVSNAWRRRFPVFRYCLGDIGRLVERGGARYLELRGRDSRSFRFNEITYDLETFAQLAGGADAFQIQLACDRLTLLLVDESGVCRPDELRAQLASLLNQPASSRAFELRLVGRQQLSIDPATSKTPQLLDLRR